MSYSKRQFVEGALAEIGLSNYQFDVEPQQQELCLRRLDSMMAEWNSIGIRIGYPIPGSPENSDLDAETNVPDAANNAIETNLALRISPIFGRQPMPETTKAAKIGYDALLSWTSTPPEMVLPNTLPAGAGNKRIPGVISPFILETPKPIDGGQDGAIQF
jgi:hypothetical protein